MSAKRLASGRVEVYLALVWLAGSSTLVSGMARPAQNLLRPPDSPQAAQTPTSPARPSAQSSAPKPLGSVPPVAGPAVPPPVSTSATSGPAVMTPTKARAVLDKLFLAESRTKDLLGTLETASWKVTDTERQEIYQSVSSVQQKIQDLEKWRYQFYYHLDDLGDGKKTQSALESLQPVVASIGAAAGTHQGTATGGQFQQVSQELANVADQLKPYISGMEARLKASLSPTTSKASAGGPGLETEVIRAQPNIKPLSSMVTQPPPLSAAQVKQLLYRVYVPAYRIEDLLSQEQPEKWKAPAPEQGAFNASRQELQKDLANLERWRAQFSEHPADLNSGFQTFVAMDRLVEPLENVTLRVEQYENPRAAANYQQSGADLRAREDDLLPYLTFLFSHRDQTVQMYQTDLSNCQNQLGFAMHGLQTRATPMKNVLPQFQGRNVKKRKAEEKKPAAKKPAPKKRASSHQRGKKRRPQPTQSGAAAPGK